MNCKRYEFQARICCLRRVIGGGGGGGSDREGQKSLSYRERHQLDKGGDYG